jgi:hypothetical protein
MTTYSKMTKYAKKAAEFITNAEIEIGIIEFCKSGLLNAGVTY